MASVISYLWTGTTGQVFLSVGAGTPQHREALFYLCDWEYGAGGWEKKGKSAKNAYVPESQQDEEKRKKGKSADKHDPTMYVHRTMR